MALFRLLRLNHKLFYCSLTNNVKLCFQHTGTQKDLYEEDVIDDFITQLIQKKMDKWQSLQKRAINKEMHCNAEKRSLINLDLKETNVEHVNLLLNDALNEGDYDKTLSILNECVRWDKCPSLSLLMQILPLLSQNGEKDLIIKLQTVCDKIHPSAIDSDFQHYLAEVTWIKGNVEKALNLFETIYRSNNFLRRRIRMTLKYLILDVVNERSEAVLLNLIKFCKKLVKDYNDYHLLGSVWQSCFLSEWYTDQCIALELLEDEGLCKEIVGRIPYVVITALKAHQTDLVQRLLDVLLKHEMTIQYSVVLTILFNYRRKLLGDLIVSSRYKVLII